MLKPEFLFNDTERAQRLDAPARNRFDLNQHSVRGRFRQKRIFGSGAVTSASRQRPTNHRGQKTTFVRCWSNSVLNIAAQRMTLSANSCRCLAVTSMACTPLSLRLASSSQRECRGAFYRKRSKPVPVVVAPCSPPNILGHSNAGVPA